MKITVILPAHDEAAYLPDCLEALLASRIGELSAEVIVVANGCSDATVEIARSHEAAAQVAGWALRVVDEPVGDKLRALQRGDDLAEGHARIYLDADVLVSPGLVAALAHVLNRDTPAYASGTPRLAPARSLVSRAYGRLWERLPFVTQDVPGFGVFAMNAAGRARFAAWPDIISDDTFARLNFAPAERILVEPTYTWPLVEGFSNLVKVRRRQNAGVAEIRARFPELLCNDAPPPPSTAEKLRLALRDPVGFTIYAAVAFAVRFGGNESRWERGR